MAIAEHTIDLRERRSSRSLPPGRTLHLVDLENLAGGSSASPSEVSEAVDAYEAVVRFNRFDHRVVACGKGLVYPIHDRWPGALVTFARGIDGADRLLLAEADGGFVAGHYERIVLASGDHAFAPLAIELDGRGVTVCVVSRRRALSRALEQAAPVVWFLDDVASSAAVA